MNKYLKDIFIHLDGIVMTPIYELISSSNIDFNDTKNISGAYMNILSSILFISPLFIIY